MAELERALAPLGASWGALFVDLETGASLGERAADEVRNPASNAKLFTAWAALRRLGAEHRFSTTLSGTLSGERVARLVLRGDGDPTLRSADVVALAAAARDAGVRAVGELAVDQSAFDSQHTPPAFDQQPGEWAPFRAPVSAVAIDGNTLTLRVRPSKVGQPATLVASPEGVVTLAGQVLTTKKSTADKLAVAPSAVAGGVRLTLSGSVPEGREVVVPRRLDDPSLAPGYVLARALRDMGITVGQVRAGQRANEPTLATHRSRPLGEVVARLGKDSDNFAAEMLAKVLGGGRFDAGMTAISEAANEVGAWSPLCRLSNGSGLFDAGRVSPRALATLVRAGARDGALAPEWLAHFAVGGVDGTLAHRFDAFAKARTVRAKTGTLRATVALSGLVTRAGGSGVVFSVVVGGVEGKTTAARAAIDSAVARVAKAVAGG
jgi:D-alanyl-D-alanine carboxypeptidase/D-alanyl-D-alanine-endopeptidase (penicillin-binding protein 4)